MKRLCVAAGLLAALAAPTAGAATTTTPPSLHLATPTRLLFHTYANGTGYFEQAPLTGSGPAKQLFRHDNEPFSVVATAHQIIWINEPRRLIDTNILIADDTGQHTRVLVRHPSDPSNLVLAGPYVYWAGTDWIGRVRLDGTDLVRHFIRVPHGKVSEAADGMTTDGRYLYVAQCVDGRIGKVPMTQRSNGDDITWLVSLPRDKNFCPQSIAYSGDHLYYAGDGGIGRIGVDGTGRDDNNWRNLPFADQPGDLVADSTYLYWDTCDGPECSIAHVARMRLSDGHLTFGLYNHIDQGLALAP